MFCRKCGKEMKPNEKFCPSCGAKVETEETVQAGSPIQNAPQSVAVDSNGTGVVKKKPKTKSGTDCSCCDCCCDCSLFVLLPEEVLLRHLENTLKKIW